VIEQVAARSFAVAGMVVALRADDGSGGASHLPLLAFLLLSGAESFPDHELSVSGATMRLASSY